MNVKRLYITLFCLFCFFSLFSEEYQTLSKKEILEKLFVMVEESEELINFFQREGYIHASYYYREVGRFEGLKQAIGVIQSMKEH